MSENPSQDFWEPQKTQFHLAAHSVVSHAKSLGRHLVDRALILTTIAWFLLLWAGYAFLEFDQNLNPLQPADWTSRNDATSLRDYAWAWSFPFGALLVSLTLVNALRRTRILQTQAEISERKEVTDQFAKGIEQLGQGNTPARVAAIVSLEALMVADFTRQGKGLSDGVMGRQIATSLLGFLRSHANGEPNDSRAGSPVDTETAFQALGRSWPTRHRGSDAERNRLNRLYFSRLNIFKNFDFSIIDFNYTYFYDCVFTGVNFNKCDLINTTFDRCVFDSCYIEDSYLIDSEFKGVEIYATRFKRNIINGLSIKEFEGKKLIISDEDLRTCRYSSDYPPDLGPLQNLARAI